MESVLKYMDRSQEMLRREWLGLVAHQVLRIAGVGGEEGGL